MVPASHVPVSPLGVETTNPAGSVSVKAIPARPPTVFGLVTRKVRVVLPPTEIIAAPKLLLIVGGFTTVMLAVPVFPVPPLVDVTVTELFCTPAVAPVTLTENVHDAPAARDAPDKLTVDAPAVAVMVPESHVPVIMLGVETTNPAGRVSVKAMPVRAPAVFGLVTRKVRLVLPPTEIIAAPKLLLIVGGFTTVMLAVPVFPVPPLVDVTVTELFCTPAVAPVTLTENVHDAPAARDAPDKLTVDAPAVAVMVPESHVPVIMLGVETTNPAGRVSVKAMPVRAPAVFGLVTRKVRLVLPPTEIIAAPKLLLIVGGFTTVMLAVPVFPVPPLVDVTVTELFCTPAVAPVTLTENVHDAPAARDAPDKLTVDAPAVAVMVPESHVPVIMLGVETTNPAGRVSVKAMPVRAPAVFGLVTRKVRLVLPPTEIIAAPKLLLIVGGFTTVMLAVPVFPVPPLVDVTVTELFCTPAVAPVTLTENVQDTPAARDAPDKLTVDAPAVAVMVPESHVPVITLGVETTNPAGRVSVKAIPVKLPVFGAGLVTLKLRLVLPPTGIVAAPKLLLMDGGAKTVVLAVAVLLAPPLLSVMVTELFCTPAVVAVTLTENVQDL